MGSSLWPWVAQLQATTSKPQQTLCGVGYVHREQIGDFVISSSMPLHLHLYRYTTESFEVKQMFEQERPHCIILSCSLGRMK